MASKEVKNTSEGHPTGSIVTALGLRDLFIRAPAKDAERRKARKEQAEKAERDSQAQAMPETIPHPFLVDHTVRVEVINRTVAENTLLDRLFGWAISKDADSTRAILSSIIAANLIPLPLLSDRVDRVKLDAWCVGFLREFLLAFGDFDKASVQAASMSELRDAWFAYAVLVAHQHHIANTNYCQTVKETKEALETVRGARGGQSGKSEEVDRAAADRQDVEDELAAVVTLWSYDDVKKAKTELNAVAGYVLLKTWAQVGNARA